MVTVTLLGCGGTQPLPDRALSALTVSVGGATLLLDCGEGTQTALRRWGVSAYRITHILLTHYHGDHILGLPGLLQTLSSLGRTEHQLRREFENGAARVFASEDLLVDGINEKLFDLLGDTAIEYGAEGPCLIDDYRDDVRELMQP